MNSRELKRKIRSIQAFERSIQPDEAWVSRTRETLLMQVKNSMSTQPVPVRRQASELYQRLFPAAWRTALRGPAFAALAVVAAMFGVSLAGVSAAEKALPGDLFYPVKIATEQARLLLTKTKTEKLIVKAELVERRAQEIKQIAALDTPGKDKRIQEASETLRRDLDTVKKQLNDVDDTNPEEPVVDLVQAVKVVDKKSEQVVNVLKDAKASVSGDTKESIEKVETAAVTTGVKAVQVLIESKDHPEVQDVLKPEELTQSIQVKVEGIQEKLVVAKEKAEVAVQLSASTTTPTPMNADASKAANALTQLETAQTTLEEAKKLLTENKLNEVKDKLGEATKAVTNAENASGSILVQKDDALIQSMTSTTASTTNPQLSGASTTTETASSTSATTSSTASATTSTAR